MSRSDGRSSGEDASGARARRRSAGIVVVRRADRAWLYLMLRAYANWDFPKGLIEAGEEPLAAARREVEEETGIEELRFNWGDAYVETAPYAGGKIARYYVAETPTDRVTLPIHPGLGRPEHHAWRWLTLDEALALAPPRLQPIVRWAAGMIGPAP